MAQAAQHSKAPNAYPPATTLSCITPSHLVHHFVQFALNVHELPQVPTRSCSPHAQRQEFKPLLRFSLVYLRFIMMRAQAQGSCLVQSNPCAFGGICCDGLNLRPAGVLCRPTPSDLPCLAPATCDGLADYCFPFLDRPHMSGMSSFCPDHVPLSGLACALNASFPASINGVCSASGGLRLP